MEVVLDGQIADDDLVRAGVELGHRRPVRQLEIDVEVGADGPGQLIPDRSDRGRNEHGRSRDDEDDKTPEAHQGTLRAARRIGLRHYARSSAPKRSASAATMRPRISAASSSESVRSGDWNAAASAIDFFPAPTCSPR